MKMALQAFYASPQCMWSEGRGGVMPRNVAGVLAPSCNNTINDRHVVVVRCMVVGYKKEDIRRVLVMASHRARWLCHWISAFVAPGYVPELVFLRSLWPLGSRHDTYPNFSSFVCGSCDAVVLVTTMTMAWDCALVNDCMIEATMLRWAFGISGECICKKIGNIIGILVHKFLILKHFRHWLWRMHKAVGCTPKKQGRF